MANSKEVAGRRAAAMIEDGMTVGLGTGSTVFFCLERLAERIREEHLVVRCVPTSVDTETKAIERDIPLATLDEVASIDITIDGADEIDENFDMIKGGGGALLREKVVASITRREVIVIGPDKLVDRLGRRFLLPVEVVPFARPTIVRRLKQLDAVPTLRMDSEGGVYTTDNGNHILDCKFEDGIPDAPALERELALLPGVVESGLFIGLAHVLVIGHANGDAEVRER